MITTTSPIRRHFPFRMMEDAVAARNRSLSRKGLELTHPNAAGIDIGSASHYVAVPADRDDQPVREFASFTADLHRLADWLQTCGVDTVAMESTGVYWIPLFELLDARGFNVLLVNARHVKNVSGRKSDVLDCQWLQQLMSYGLLRGAFRPDDQVCVLRALARQRSTLDAFDFCGQQLQECDEEIEAQLQRLHITEIEPDKGKKRSKARNAPKFDLRTRLFQMCGVDLTRIDGIDVTTALVVVSEIGADMSRFPTDKHFASWLGLCPGALLHKASGRVLVD
ncbi:transposase [Ideonella sp. BYS139W]|uniref:Transposase n=2 Tax=Pseudaquabacterium rugosum TaxID=2984194 RepID=A0ABU9BGG8_9BURK